MMQEIVGPHKTNKIKLVIRAEHNKNFAQNIFLKIEALSYMQRARTKHNLNFLFLDGNFVTCRFCGIILITF